MLALLAALAAMHPIPSVRVERSRDAIPNGRTSVSTSLDTNGLGSGQIPIDAERAFAADAQALGQWTAFRKWAAAGAVMFVPQPTDAQAWLKDRKDPLHAVEWWPTASYVSCDGSLAVNTGGWKRADGSVGYFTTVWQRQADGSWKWIVDSGDVLKVARPHPAEPKVVRTKCRTRTSGPFAMDEAMAVQEGEGGSADETLHWRWRVADEGGRTLVIWGYDGTKLTPVISDNISAAQ